MVGMPSFQCKACEFDPGVGNEDPTHLEAQPKN